MSDNQHPQSLEYVIVQYLEQVERGESPDREQLLRAHPQLADSLRGFFVNHDQMQAALGGGPQDKVTTPPVADSGTSAEDATIPPSAGAGEDAENATIPPGSSSEDTATIPSSGSGQSPAIGTTVRYFGDYELVEEIARGGMGVVYKARQVNLNRIVALKMILSGQLAGEEDVQRFHAEAEAAANLDHPGIVPIFEIGEHEGQHYFSMGFVEGESLADKIKDGPLPPRVAAEYVQKIAEAMAFAHERGVIHRDLKPANVLVDRNDQPKVTDFGLAKKTQADSGLTATGQVLGTPSYMPPEQAAGKIDDITESADVYSLGAILYALVTGRPPFQAASTMDTLLQVLEREPTAPRQLDPSIPRDLETICLKCLAKDPPRRYADSSQLQADLGRWLSGDPIQARRVSRLEKAWLWCRRRPMIAGLGVAMLILLAISGTIFELQRRTSLNERVENAVHALENAPTPAVPSTIRALESLPRSRVLPLLKHRFASADHGKLALALALGAYGEAPLDYLIGSMGEAPPALRIDIATALEGKPEEALRRLRAHAKQVSEWAESELRATVTPYRTPADRMEAAKQHWIHKGHLALVALQLGDTALAADVHAMDRGDPTQQTVFIHDVFPTWDGDLSRLVRNLRGVEQESWAAGICLALGKLDSAHFEFESDRDAVVQWLGECYRSRHSGNHSAALWALNQLKSDIPAVPDKAGEPARDWRVTPHDFTLIRMPAGEDYHLRVELENRLETRTHVTLTRDVWVSDTEVTVGLFQQFIDDPAYPAEQKPRDWKGVDGRVSPTNRHPVQKVSWEDAVLFCNWLSERDGLRPHYQVEGEMVTLLPGANGYRLLTESEWVYACRAGSTTRYCYGGYGYGGYRGDEERLSDYAVHRGVSAGPVRSKMCNRWGLFDMHGNVFEWCYDPSGRDAASKQVARGGSWLRDAGSRFSGNGERDPPYRTSYFGFRVACGPRSVEGSSTRSLTKPELGQ